MNHPTWAEVETLEVILDLNAVLRKHNAALRRYKDGLYVDVLRTAGGVKRRAILKIGPLVDWTKALPTEN